MNKPSAKTDVKKLTMSKYAQPSTCPRKWHA